MNTLILITSIVTTPKTPFNYSNTRSTFTENQRFEQTKETIKSVRKFYPTSKIFLIEYGNTKEEYTTFFKNNCDYFLDIYIKYPLTYQEMASSNSKSLGEGAQTTTALNYILKKDIHFEVLIKISGRYFLTGTTEVPNSSGVAKEINKNDGVTTVLYSIPRRYINDFLFFLNSQKERMKHCVGYEVIFGDFIRSIPCKFVSKLNISGLVSVDGDFYSG